MADRRERNEDFFSVRVTSVDGIASDTSCNHCNLGCYDERDNVIGTDEHTGEYKGL
jgi:hypothetical protein